MTPSMVCPRRSAARYAKTVTAVSPDPHPALSLEERGNRHTLSPLGRGQGEGAGGEGAGGERSGGEGGEGAHASSWVTRKISSTVVSPAHAFAQASSRKVSMPCATAYRRI